MITLKVDNKNIQVSPTNKEVKLIIQSAPLYINYPDDNIISNNKLWSSYKINQELQNEITARQNEDLTIQNNLNTHLLDYNNPHNVTKEQIGLGNVPNLDTTFAVNNAHTHTNKALLDSYTNSNADISDAISKKHEHSNKALLDTYNQTNADITDAVNKRHNHSNQVYLDTINQNLGTTNTPTFNNILINSLINNYIPYKTAAGLVNSPIAVNGNKIGIGTASAGAILEIVPTSTNDVVFRTKSLQSTAPLGSELVINGDFANSSGWTWGTGWVWDSTNQEADHTTGNTAPLTQSISVTAGETYHISFQIKNRTAGSISIDINGVYIYESGNSTAFNSNATHNRSFVANTTGSVLLTITPTTDFDGSIDNVSVKQITKVSQPNFAFIDSNDSVFSELRGNNSLYNLSLGLNAGRLITTGYNNSNFGKEAGYSITVGFSNSNFGATAGRSITIGSNNNNFGLGAGYSITSGYSNCNYGSYAGYLITTGYSNNNFGYNAGCSITTGYYNNNFGVDAGRSITTGSNNLFAGYSAGNNINQKVDATNTIGLGGYTYTTANNQVVIGSGTTTHGLGIIPALTGNGLDLNGSTLRLRSSRTPASATATGNAGEMCWDSNYIYICVATNTWKRASLTTW